MASAGLSRRSMLLGFAAMGMTARPASAVADIPPVPVESRLAPLARRKGVPFGSAIDLGDLARDDLKTLYQAHCTSLTPRNAMKWSITEKRRGKFDFAAPDRIIDFATANNMQVYGHTLVWHNLPNSISRITVARQLDAAMQRHINTQVRHFAGKVVAWDVVNEPMEYDSDQLRATPFMKVIGEGYIATALQAAHVADPKATLLINETHLEKKGQLFDNRRTVFLGLIDRVLAARAPLNAIGIQGHFRPGFDTLDEQAFGSFCAELKQRKLGVYITELDASCRFIERDKSFTADNYGSIFERLIMSAVEKGQLLGITVWGLSERYATAVPREITSSCRKRINLYDENDVPRSTLAAIVRAYEAMPDVM